MPSPSEKVAIVRNPDQSFVLVAVAKRTYAIEVSGGGRATLSLADEQAPLLDDPVLDTMEGFGEIIDDADVIAQKVATDVVVTGHAYAPGGKAKEAMISVAVGKMARRLSVIGTRRVEVRPDGTVRFTPTESFSKVPLSSRFAYGGYDAYAQERLEPVPKGLRESLDEPATGLYAYARSTLGRGFFVDVDRSRADGELLPQIEDPTDPLLPESFFVPTVEAWIDAPISASMWWMHYTSYPRLYRMVGTLLHHAPPTKPIREATFPDGSDLLSPWKPGGGNVPARVLQGAAPGLACERLRGDELVILENLHPEHPRIEVSLPGEMPLVTVKPPDVKALQPAPVLQTVRLEPDKQKLSLTWCASLPMAAPSMEIWVDRVELGVSWKKR